MHNERSAGRRESKKDEVLSAAQTQALERGQELKKYVHAAAALNGIYDDKAIGNAAGVKRGAVAAWWTGSRMSTDAIQKLAEATGLSRDELTAFVHYGGPPPNLPNPLAVSIREGVRQAQADLADEAPDTPPSSPERQPRDTEAGRG